ncbi:acetyl-CoA synthetase-like protein [Aspergillus terreus]|uniref:Acetyl-CoA synthetase-like protein n=1 Tax=Aspergillus terreus TaxID=33178 RepID=A0A5M3YXB4_ASPTE|nr:hypothetical protein ATETN484_0004010500 [Aspergillus terreus]GFF12995.1 acetyl-CoA synthetase-like protein [Aspergillus terreus]
MTLNNLQALLRRVAARDNSGHVVVYDLGSTKDPKSYSYQDLLRVAIKASVALRKTSDLHPGSVILLHFDNHWDNIVWFWAASFAGCLPAISASFSNDASQRAAHIERLSTTLMHPLCLTNERIKTDFAGQDAIQPLAVETLVLNGDVSLEALPQEHPEPSLSDDALLLFTSGSSGNSKGVCLSHGQILASISGKYAVRPLPDNTSFLNWVGLDHVAAIVEIHLQAMYALKTQIHVPAADILSSPANFLQLLEKHRVSRTFAPNFFLAKLRDLLQENDSLPEPRRWDLRSLEYVASGGEANVTKTCDRLSEYLVAFGAPKDVIVPGFGMTETCAGSIFNTRCPEYDKSRSAEFASVGTCMPGISMRVTDLSNNVLPPGEIGHLQLTGLVVFKRYFNNASATEEAFTPDGWFKTGDMGCIDENGCLTLTGRAKENMIINGVNHSPHEIETALDKIPGLTPSYSCCFSFFPSGGETEEICVVYLPTYSPDDLAARAQTADAISKTVLMCTGSRPHVLPLEREALPKSSLGKLARAKIKAAYERGEYAAYQNANNELMRRYRETTRAEPQNDLEKTLLEVFTRSLSITDDAFDVKTPIFDVGINSVELIRLKRDIEDHLGMAASAIPMIMLMTHSTVRDLATALEKLQGPREYDPVVTLQSHGHKNPLWLVHPGAGEVLVFINLAQYIVDRPVYALRARGFNDGEQPFETIEEATASYYNGIRSRQPHGPYALAGYCYGSMLAFEVAKMLESHGEEVRFLGSFNLPPHIKMRMRELDWKECLLHLAYFLDLVSQKRSREMSVELEGLSHDEILDSVIQNANMERYAELSLNRPLLVRWADVAYELHRMAFDYDPAGCVAGMDVFFSIPLAIAAASKTEWRNVHLSQWEDFTRTVPKFHDVAGEHYSMIGPDHVFSFQKTLRKALEERGM